MNANDLARRVQRERTRRGWTQQEVADRAGISKRTYQNFEAGTTSPQGANLRAILEALEMSTEQEDIAEATRESWRGSTRVIVDVIGAYLETLDEEDAIKVGHEFTRQIWQRRALNGTSSA